METAEPPDYPPPPLRRRARRLVFDQRYGWIFDEWMDPADQALSSGRGMFCVVPMAQSLVKAAASSFSHVASSVSRIFGQPKQFSPPAYMSSLLWHKKQQTWFRELGDSGVIADLKLIDNGTPYGLESLKAMRVAKNGAVTCAVEQ